MILEKYRKTVGVQKWKQNDGVRQNATLLWFRNNVMAKPSGVVMYPNKNRYKQPETAYKGIPGVAWAPPGLSVVVAIRRVKGAVTTGSRSRKQRRGGRCNPQNERQPVKVKRQR